MRKQHCHLAPLDHWAVIRGQQRGQYHYSLLGGWVKSNRSLYASVQSVRRKQFWTYVATTSTCMWGNTCQSLLPRAASIPCICTQLRDEIQRWWPSRCTRDFHVTQSWQSPLPSMLRAYSWEQPWEAYRRARAYPRLFIRTSPLVIFISQHHHHARRMSCESRVFSTHLMLLSEQSVKPLSTRTVITKDVSHT